MGKLSEISRSRVSKKSLRPDTGVCGENKKIKNKLNRKIEERRGERGRFSYNSLRYKHRLARSTGAS